MSNEQKKCCKQIKEEKSKKKKTKNQIKDEHRRDLKTACASLISNNKKRNRERERGREVRGRCWECKKSQPIKAKSVDTVFSTNFIRAVLTENFTLNYGRSLGLLINISVSCGCQMFFLFSLTPFLFFFLSEDCSLLLFWSEDCCKGSCAIC